MARSSRDFKKLNLVHPNRAAPKNQWLEKVEQVSTAEAERLMDLEAKGIGPSTVLRDGVTKPLLDLALDWQRADHRTT